MIMLLLGVILGHAVNMKTGAIAAAIGLLLWVVIIVYKALHWEQYRRDNQINIIVMLGAILTIFILFFLKR